MIRRWVHLDYETFSEADLSKVGVSKYARDPSTEVLMLAYADSKGAVRQWVPAIGEPMPDELREMFDDPEVGFIAWNAPFEMAITWFVLGIEVAIERWRCAMALAYSLSLPGKLEKAGKVIGLPAEQQKIARGRLLVRKFCKPRKPSKHKPWTRSTFATDLADWLDFLEYNRQDVEAERSIWRKLRRWQLPEHEWALWHLDQKINWAGIPINLNAVAAAQRLARITIKADLAEMKAITGLANPNSGPQLLPWLRAHGYPYEDLKKGHIAQAAKALEGMAEEDRRLLGMHPDLARVLELRARVSKASVKKFNALADATDDDGMLRGAHQYAGAGRTWRWAGRRFQSQNLPRPEKYLEKVIPRLAWEVEHLHPGVIDLLYDNPMDVLTGVIRPMVQAPEGYILVDADLHAIENVVLGWLAADDRILRVFRKGLDPYIDFATRMFGLPYDRIAEIVEAGDKTMRTIAKPGVLGCGYMLGPGEEHENPRTGEMEATGLLGYGRNMGVELTPEMSAKSVRVFRATFKKVVDFWWDLDRAARRLIRTGKPQKVGYLTFDRSGPFMRIVLPSGRALHYLRPKLLPRRTPWGEVKLQVTYENLENQQWRRVSTHPGKLAENVTQAVARDILANGMVLADRRGLDLRMHVHDQLVGLSPAQKGKRQLRILIDSLTTLPDWADDKLPLKAAGAATPVFLKD